MKFWMIFSERKFIHLKKKGRIGRLTEEELIKVLNGFKCKSIQLPEDKFLELCPIEIEEKVGDDKFWHLDIDLWCNEKESDLTLSLKLKKETTGTLNAEILDLHVL